MGVFDDIMRNIFGGREQHQQATQQASSTGQSAAQSTSTQGATSTPGNYNPFTAALSPALISALSGYLGGGLPSFGGPMVAPISDAETNVLGQLNAQTAPGNPRQNYLGDVLSGKFLAPNPYLDAYIESAQRGTKNALTETLDRTLPGKFTQAGQFVNRGATGEGSSAFDRAAAVATRGAASALGDIATNIAYPAYAAERQNQQQAVALSQAEVDTTVKNLQAQALPRMIQDLGIERGLDEFKTRLDKLLQLLATVGGVAAPSIANLSTSTGASQSTSQAREQSGSFGQSTGDLISSEGLAKFFIPLPSGPK